MTAVLSSTINDLTYDPKKQSLVVTFKNNNKFEYDGVPPDVYQKVATATSVGSTFDKLIKKGNYKHKKL